MVRRFLVVFLSLFVLFCPVYAADNSEAAAGGEFFSSGSSVVSAPSVSFDDLVSVLSQLFVSEAEGELIDAVLIPVSMADDGIAPAYIIDNGTTSEPTGTLKSILVKLIGPYNPVIVEYRYQTTTSGNYSYIREIQPDYVWWGSAGLFCLVVWCTFRLGGVLLRKI